MRRALQTRQTAGDAATGKGHAVARRDRQFVTGLSRGLKLLEAFRPGDEFVTNAELARRTGLPRPTITRLAHTLCELGYLGRGDDRRGYRLHPHVLSLGQPILVKLRIRQIARPLMQQLADESRFSIALGVRDGLDMIFIERTRVSTTPSLAQDIGSRVPIAITSMGRAYLAGLRRRERESLWEQLSRVGSKENWIKTRAAIDRELERYRTHGYCFGLGEWKAHTCGVSVPVVLRDGSVLSMNCGGMCTHMTGKRLDEMGERLKAMAKQILSSQGADW
ncbi:MAG: IclR family transcriptional regulator [Hyphomicrobiaceae bacterium]|nr:MAG: IclR family transcriptional regulator [Hyphomicrobiaceae bacterium]